ncbi:MAG: SRPBCC family protein [Planctomycetota bacterium]
MILKTVIVAGAVVASGVGTVNAHQPRPQAPPPRVVGSVPIDSVTSAPVRVIRSVTLDATPGVVFDFVTDHRNWPGLVGPIDSVSVRGSGGPGSTWAVSFGDGSVVGKRIVALAEPRDSAPGTFAYAITDENPFGVQDHLSVVVMAPADGGGTVLHYHQFLNHADTASIVPMIASGTDEIVGNVLARFGGSLRGASDGGGVVRIDQQRVIEASADRVWTVLGAQWAAVHEWASAIAHSEAIGWSDADPEGAVRSCEVPGTPGFRERMLSYDEGTRTLSYQVIAGVPPFAERAVNTWTIEELSDERVVVRSAIEIDIAPGTPGRPAGMMMSQFTHLMDLTFDEFVYYAETGRVHPRAIGAGSARR